MARARRRSKVVIDGRTSTMSDEALRCRADGHPWTRVYDPIAVVEKMIKEQGVVEKRWVCSCCTAERTLIRDAYTGRLVAKPAIKYKDESYLIKDGSGRMSRDDAALADLARTYATLY